MSELLKIISIALVTVLAHILIKQTKPEIAILVAIVGSIILIISSINLLSSVVNSFYEPFIVGTGCHHPALLRREGAMALSYSCCENDNFPSPFHSPLQSNKNLIFYIVERR